MRARSLKIKQSRTAKEAPWRDFFKPLEIKTKQNKTNANGIGCMEGLGITVCQVRFINN